MVKIFKAVPTDSLSLAATLRQSDATELAALHGMMRTPYDAIEYSRSASRWLVWSAFVGPHIACMFGCVDLGGHVHDRIGSPWLLCSEHFSEVPVKQVLRTSKAFMRLTTWHFNYMFNYVHAGNEKTLRWLRKCGFAVHPAEPYGPYDEPFHKITIGGFNV